MNYNAIAFTNELTVVAQYSPQAQDTNSYQSEDALEKELINLLTQQGYQYLKNTSQQSFLDNLKQQLEKLNNISFSKNEWETLLNQYIAPANQGIIEKTKKIQEDYIYSLVLDNGNTKNIYLLDKKNIHNNSLQVINQYEESAGTYKNRYDVTILVNGLPLIHIELKRRGVALKEAFNQINRYQKESFWAAFGFFEYVQIFVISNGTHTKYYSNTTRQASITEQMGHKKSKNAHSFEFTNFWADAHNNIISDLVDFTKTFFSKHTLLNILTKYCVFTSENLLLVMRPYQIAATERILHKIILSSTYKQKTNMQTTPQEQAETTRKIKSNAKGGGYIWHTTGSGKTLTSFKTAVLTTQLPEIDKVIFVVDRKDLDYQTMKEYDRFEKGAANGNTSTAILKRQLENKNKNGGYQDYKIIVTTIQKLDIFVKKNKNHPIYKKNIVLIFDECHRSQFGDMHKAIVKSFKNYYIFGFTGTPIFAANATSSGKSAYLTTEQVFGEQIHAYTVVDAINDNNVLPFRIDYVNTIKNHKLVEDTEIYAIDQEKALLDPYRIKEIVSYILTHFNQKTKRSSVYSFMVKSEKEINKKRIEKLEERQVGGFNSIFAVASIPMAIKYYAELKKQIQEQERGLKIAMIYSFSPNEEEAEGILEDEDLETHLLDPSYRDFLALAIKDYNGYFNTFFDTSADKFQNYYKDLSLRVKNKEIDILIVVNMFLTGFDATTLNTLWVDKNLRLHGLMQAFSRTNRILNSVKTFGNIVCFRDLKEATDKAIALFGNKDAGGIVLLRTYKEYYNGYTYQGKYQLGYKDLIQKLNQDHPLNSPYLQQSLTGDINKKKFIKLFGQVLKLRNILTSFDEFEKDTLLPPRDLQDYQSIYIDLYHEFRSKEKADKENINQDIVFEVELIKQVEVNIDYILILIAQYQESLCKDKDILNNINRIINSSLQLRSKKKLIEDFIQKINVSTKVEKEWQEFLQQNKKIDLEAIIKEENLKEEETLRFIENSFRDGVLKTTGTDIDRILPPVSRFSSDNRPLKKEQVINKLLNFFEKYFGLI